MLDYTGPVMVEVRMEETPNPNARRYVVDRPVQEGARGRFYTSPEQTQEPLVTELLALEGAAGVMLLPNSVTVNKHDGASWTDLDPKVRATLTRYFT
jgi:hypothetical protein